MKTPKTLLIESLQAYLNQIPFVQPLGIVVKQAEQGFVSLTMEPAKTLLNHFETYQAGSLFTLAEVTGGTLCGTFLDLSKNLLITKKGEISFLKATSKALVAEAKLDSDQIKNALIQLKESKKTDFPVTVVIKTGDSEVISECHFIYYLRIGIPEVFLKPSSVKSHD